MDGTVNEARRHCGGFTGTGSSTMRMFSTAAPPTATRPDPRKMVTRRLYRILQRQCNELERVVASSSTSSWLVVSDAQTTKNETKTTPGDSDVLPLLLQPPFFPQQWGTSRLFVDTSLTQQTQSKTQEDDDDIPAIWHLFFRQWKRHAKSPQPPRQGTTTAHDQTSTATAGEVPSLPLDAIAGVQWYQQLQNNWQQQQHQQQRKQMQLSTRGSGTGKDDNVVVDDNASNDDQDSARSPNDVSSADVDDEETDDAVEECDGERATMWTNVKTLRAAIRMAFRYGPASLDQPNIASSTLQQWAVQAYHCLQQQQQYAMHTSHSRSIEHGIRVTAVSQYIGSDQEPKHRFAYRIRIENTSPITTATDHTFQLLGRTWLIQQVVDDAQHPPQAVGAPKRIHCPQLGAVGKLPVLRPGHVFEYVRGAELEGTTGLMQGCFHFAKVPPHTESAELGMPLPILEQQAQATAAGGEDDTFFQVNVAPFPLRVGSA